MPLFSSCPPRAMGGHTYALSVFPNRVHVSTLLSPISGLGRGIATWWDVKSTRASYTRDC